MRSPNCVPAGAWHLDTRSRGRLVQPSPEKAPLRLLLRKIEQLARDFAELATLDVGLPAAEKKNVALLAAFRPWVSSMFQEIKPKSP